MDQIENVTEETAESTGSEFLVAVTATILTAAVSAAGAWAYTQWKTKRQEKKVAELTAELTTKTPED